MEKIQNLDRTRNYGLRVGDTEWLTIETKVEDR